jgi:hypothetical protein
MKKTKTRLIVWMAAAILAWGNLPQKAQAAEAIDYFAGCLMALGAGLAGTAFANQKIEGETKINTAGYGIAGGLSCLTGMAFVGIVGNMTRSDIEFGLKKENAELSYQLRRLSKERCLLRDTCTPGGKSIIVDSEPEVKKMGDKVFETSTSIIEPNE